MLKIFLSCYNEKFSFVFYRQRGIISCGICSKADLALAINLTVVTRKSLLTAHDLSSAANTNNLLAVMSDSDSRGSVTAFR